MNYNKRQREEYNTQREMTCNRLGIKKNTYNYFRRMGNKLRGIYEDNCSGSIGSYKICDLLIESITVPVNLKAKENKLYIYFQSDPRGATIYLSREKIDDVNYIRGEAIY